ncbi:GTPase [Bailinhaonella thermotolerans]|uniref:ABC transporter n=1 Tax=Bailinhaonella thermotolerans TaxID=1070861 RepID=A0A3A4A936_9ACTN|nr:GTPase [Bailinhaonella thermotolerans]RJL22784.1 ABC transporter [Bailinhaonella thermotolerans]
MTTTTQARAGLAARLGGLQRAVEHGAGQVDPAVLREASALLGRAGERLTRSADHTVVALAGGTGSGKSSLFNALSGLDLSPVGVRRPTTGHTHACVWGADEAAPLLDWLRIPWRYRFSRASALDRHDSGLGGLILLDLPDHDSVRAMADGEADRMIMAADMIVWVLDPQKYADASVHRRYVTELAGRDAITVFVLNQADRLMPEEVAECVEDLTGLLRREGVADPRVLVTSATERAGIDGLRAVLAQAVASRQAANLRIEADLDRLTPRLVPFAPQDEPPPTTVDEGRRAGLMDALTDAVGVPAVGEALENGYSLRAAHWVGWPYSRWAARLRRDPLRRMRLGDVREEIRGMLDEVGAATVQPAEVGNALDALADGVTAGMPGEWRRAVREASRSRAAELPEAISEAVASSPTGLDRVPFWWRLFMVWQYLLVLLVVVGVLWIGSIVVYGVARAGIPPLGPMGAVSLLPWLGLAVVSSLGLGLLSAIACRNLIVLGAGRERERRERDMRSRIEAVAEEYILAPVERELTRYHDFHAALAQARAR